MISSAAEAEISPGSPGAHRREKSCYLRRADKDSSQEGHPHRQPDHTGYRQVPTLWGQMPLVEIGSRTESADKMLGDCVLGPAQGSPGLCARAGAAQEPPHPGVADRPFDQ